MRFIAVAAKLAESVEGDAGSDDVRYDALRFLAGASTATAAAPCFVTACSDCISVMMITPLPSCHNLLYIRFHYNTRISGLQQKN